MEVRAARPDDLAPLTDVLESILTESNSYLSTELPLDRAARIGRWRALLADPASAMFVVCLDGTPVGEIALGEHPEYGLLLGMMIAAAHRGHGAGTRLLDAGIEWAVQHGYERVALLVFAQNEKAIRLYEKFHFVAVDYFERDVVRKNGDVFDTILMQRDLRQ